MLSISEIFDICSLTSRYANRFTGRTLTRHRDDHKSTGGGKNIDLEGVQSDCAGIIDDQAAVTSVRPRLLDHVANYTDSPTPRGCSSFTSLSLSRSHPFYPLFPFNLSNLWSLFRQHRFVTYMCSISSAPSLFFLRFRSLCIVDETNTMSANER